MQRCFQSVQWLSNVSTWPVLFKEQGSIKVWSCLWKWIMSWTKEILRTSEKELMLLIRLEKVTKPSLKSLDSTNPQSGCVQMEEIQDHYYLPKKWLTNKDHSKSGCVIVCEVAKVPRVTSKQLKGIVHPKMKILSSFTHPQVVPNLYECLCSAEHKGRYSE